MLGVDERGDAAQPSGVLAMMWSVRVVLPLDSGPKISMTRPRGMPLPPRAISRLRLPVGMPSMLRWLIAVQLHDGAFAELLFDLLNGARERRIAGRIARNLPFNCWAFCRSFRRPIARSFGRLFA